MSENGVHAVAAGVELIEERAVTAPPSVPEKRPSKATPKQLEALASVDLRGGLALAALDAMAEEYAIELRAELNALAGGTAPASVHAMAEIAVGCMVDWQMARKVARGVFGRWTDVSLTNETDEQASKVLRNVAGLAVVARDMLERTRQAAKDAKTEQPGTPASQLLNKLGVGRPAPAGQERPGSGKTHQVTADPGPASAPGLKAGGGVNKGPYPPESTKDSGKPSQGGGS